jgi:dihydroneopterin aldolase
MARYETFKLSLLRKSNKKQGGIPTMDKMVLHRMEYYGYHGVFPEERKLGQRFYIDLELELDLREAGEQDALDKTVNYAEVHYTVKDIVEKESYQLIEALGERIASSLLDTYTSVNALTVKVTKPHPPFDIHFQGVTVELYRARK